MLARCVCVCVKERESFYPNSVFTTCMQIINLIKRLYIIFIKLMYCTNSVYIEEYKVYSLLGKISKIYIYINCILRVNQFAFSLLAC